MLHSSGRSGQEEETVGCPAARGRTGIEAQDHSTAIAHSDQGGGEKVHLLPTTIPSLVSSRDLFWLFHVLTFPSALAMATVVDTAAVTEEVDTNRTKAQVAQTVQSLLIKSLQSMFASC